MLIEQKKRNKSLPIRERQWKRKKGSKTGKKEHTTYYNTGAKPMNKMTIVISSLATITWNINGLN